jgi:zinc D-Ala-D-Ala carboxypeptidase
VRATAFTRTVVCGALLALLLFPAGPAAAWEFTRTLKEGMTGKDVKALQVRIAGWFPRADKTHFGIDGEFGPTTTDAVRSFEKFYGLPVDGVAGTEVFKVIDRLEDDDGSTLNFAWSEFTQNRSGNCSAGANAYAGTFEGGMASPKRVKLNVKRMMWRLEAIRAKAGDHAIGINSGFRSAPYNDCIGGAGVSQHMFGTAADNRIAATSNRQARNLAKASQVHGIGCYSKLEHNHFDTRIDNEDLNSQRAWWWPERDSAGRDLDESGSPCWGEKGHKRTGDEILSVEAVAIFAALGEVADLAGAD